MVVCYKITGQLLQSNAKGSLNVNFPRLPQSLITKAELRM